MDESKHVLEQCLLMDPTNLLLPEHNTKILIQNKVVFCNHGTDIYLSVRNNALFS